MINAAIIGAGNISRMHLEGYGRFLEGCRIVSLADITPEKEDEQKRSSLLSWRGHSYYDLWWRGTREKVRRKAAELSLIAQRDAVVLEAK